MSDLQSPLPPEPEFWDRLARRISEDAAEPLASYQAGAGAWYGVLARRAPWLVGSSIAAMLLLWAALPADTPPDAVEEFVAPTEIAGALLGGPEPPTVDQLMVHFPPREGRPAR